MTLYNFLPFCIIEGIYLFIKFTGTGKTTIPFSCAERMDDPDATGYERPLILKNGPKQGREGKNSGIILKNGPI